MSEILPQDVGRRLGNLGDLPQELLDQIPSVRTDQLEKQILDVMRADFEGVAAVDEVLVGLYRSDGTIHDRTKIATKLYRMTSARLLESVKQKRGVYRIP